MHVCWGNYEGPHHHDVPLADIVDLVLAARPAAVSFEAANPRHAHEWAVFEDVALPEGKIVDPGRARLDDELHRAPRPRRAADRPLRRARRARERHRGQRLRLRELRRPQQAVDPAIVWAKLAAMAEGARRATRTLW